MPSPTIIRSTALALCLALPGWPAAAPAAGPTYTAGQAKRGQTSYQHWCQTCHGSDLDNGEFGGPPLRGSWFRSHWGNGDVGALFAYVRTAMPPDNPSGLNDTTYVDILAFILQANGYPTGSAELPPDANALSEMTLRREGP
ncbi:MAG TPA: cytochrome c [Xanthobacteraceae bacterium]|jgi:mono/diheme cytochrome c family protein